MRLLLIDTRSADWPPDLDAISDREAAKLAIGFVRMSQGLLAFVGGVLGWPSRN